MTECSLPGQVIVLNSGDSWVSRQGKRRRVIVVGVVEVPDGMELEHGFQYYATCQYGGDPVILINKTVRRMLTPEERKRPIRDLVKKLLEIVERKT